MATVVHILKDGTKVDSIAGHVVRIDDAVETYQIMKAFNRKNAKRKIHKVK